MPTPLPGATALLTGASQGIGPFIARTLAAERVNLALAARSADKLEDVAQGIRALGVRCVAVPADVTNAGDRERLVDEAERALGPIDILVNNAGVEHGGRFATRPPAEIARTVETNVLAPMLLARRVLPDMIARGRGHVVNVASLAGKVGYPYASVYGGTKAALIAWGNALRVELGGTGVSVTTVSPGYVRDAGMFAAHYVKPPSTLGETTPGAVAHAIVRALREDPIEIHVSGRPFWPVQVMYAIAPRRTVEMFRRLGVFDYFKQMLDRE
jgi:short-subunit dehydrogenase